MARTILVIDDEQNMRWVLDRALAQGGYDVVTAERGEQGLQLFARHAVDLVLLDLKMPGMDGLSVLRELRRRDDAVPILLLTAYATVPTAVEALKIGASDYVRKPFDVEALMATIHRYLTRAVESEIQQRSPVQPPHEPPSFDAFVGAAQLLQPALARAQSATTMLYPVILRGECGSGRRRLARLIHGMSPAQEDSRLVELDCATLPPAVISYELLAEASADDAGGRWQDALGGALLLANIHELPSDLVDRAVDHLRAYLLSKERPHGLRLFLTTSAPLGESWQPLVEIAFQIELPPLRDRLDDLPLLLAHFAPEAAWDRQALAMLEAYEWPGNVAEFRRVVQQAVRLADREPVQAKHLPGHLISDDHRVAGVFVLPPEGINLDEVERDLIEQALELTRGNKTQAARLLGLSRATLIYRIDKYSVLADDPSEALDPEE